MAIYRFSYCPNGFRVYAYVGLPPSLGVCSHNLEHLLKASLGDKSVRNVRLVAENWPRMREHTRPRQDNADFTQSGRQYPVLVYCRGGIGRVGPVRIEWLHDFLQRGFIVIAPCYRHAEGGEGKDEFGGAENDDVVSLVHTVIHFPFVDRNRIAVMGFSRGAINAVQTCLESPHPRQLIVWGGVSDLAATYEERPSLRRMLNGITGGNPKTVPDAYACRSPIHLVPTIQCRTLIVHGTRDVQVDVSHAIALQRALITAGKPVTMHLYEGIGHHLAYLVHQAVIDRMADWVHGV